MYLVMDRAVSYFNDTFTSWFTWSVVINGWE